MKTFNYTARSTQGDLIEGVAESNSREEAIAQLRAENLIVTKMDEVLDSPLDVDLRLGTHKAKEKTLAVVCKQFSILLKAGLPITRTLQMVSSQCEDKTLKQVFKDAADDVSAGYGLASSLEKNGSGLPYTFIESVRAGEESGALEVVFERLSAYYDKQSKTKSKVKSAMIYPSFVMVVAVVVVAIIMIFAVPVFTEAYAGMGQSLPGPTRFVIWSSNFWRRWWWAVALLVVGVALALQLGKKNERFHTWWSRMSCEIPVIGRINLMGAASEYAGTMGVMMAAGLPIVRAVGVTARSMTNYFMGQSLAATMPDLEAGRTLAAALTSQGTLPELAVEMTSVGEQTGSLESTLEVVSEYYDNEVELATSAALTVLEPTIILFLGVIVFVLLLAVYLPMFNMYGEGGIGG